MINFKLLIAQLSRQAQTLVPQRAPAFTIHEVARENSSDVLSPCVTPGRGHCLPPLPALHSRGRSWPGFTSGTRSRRNQSEFLTVFLGGKISLCFPYRRNCQRVMSPLGLSAAYDLACKSFGTWQPILLAVHLSCLALKWCYLKLQDWFEFTKTLTNSCGCHIPRDICVIFITTKPQWI